MTPSPPPSPPPETEDTGLPGFRSWRSVYVFVLVVFAAIVGFLWSFEGWFAS